MTQTKTQAFPRRHVTPYTATITTAAGALARELSRGSITARELAQVLDILHAALQDNVDDRIAGVLADASYDLDHLQEDLDHEACECPMEPVRADMLDPPERKRSRTCPVHGQWPQPEWEAEYGSYMP